MAVPSQALPGLERKPGVQNWIERLPAPMRAAWHRSWIYRDAKHLAVKPGYTVGHAIAVAKNAAVRGCTTGDLNFPGVQHVNVKSKAEMCAAVALWETMRATAHADTSIPADERQAIDLAFQWVDRQAASIDLSEEFSILTRTVADGLDENGVASTRPKRRLLNLIRRAIFADHLLDLAPSTAERNRAESKGQAMTGGRFPIRNRDDLQKAIRAVGRARPNTEEERRKVRRFIIKRARALNATNLVPDNWNSDGSLK